VNSVLILGFVLITAAVGILDGSGAAAPLVSGQLHPVPMSSSRPEQSASAQPAPSQAAVTRPAARAAQQRPAVFVPARSHQAARPRVADGGPPYPPLRLFPVRAADPQPVLPPLAPLPEPIRIEGPVSHPSLPLEAARPALPGRPGVVRAILPGVLAKLAAPVPGAAPIHADIAGPGRPVPEIAAPVRPASAAPVRAAVPMAVRPFGGTAKKASAAPAARHVKAHSSGDHDDHGRHRDRDD
jgi:hypothetical protein